MINLPATTRCKLMDVRKCIDGFVLQHLHDCCRSLVSLILMPFTAIRMPEPSPTLLLTWTLELIATTETVIAPFTTQCSVRTVK
jgi:hypothetical protein